jgi:hypothetical protein
LTSRPFLLTARASRCRSYNCQLAFLPSGCCVFERGKDVLAFQVGVIGQQLVDAGASGKLTEHRADGHAGVADAGRPRIRFGSTVIRSRAIGQGHLAARPLPRLQDQCKAESGGIAANPCTSASFWELVPKTEVICGDGLIGLGAFRARPDPPTCRGFAKKRLMGFEPTTFCMAMAKVAWEPRPTTIGICGGFGHRRESGFTLLYEAICADMQGFGHFSREVPKTRRAGSSTRGPCGDTPGSRLLWRGKRPMAG